MRVLPLLLHAGARVPALTTLFSDPFAVTSMAVVQSGTVTLTTPRPHGLPVGSSQALCIVDSAAPNAITSATNAGNGNWTFGLAAEHDLSDPTVNTWNLAVNLTGFTNALFNAEVQLVGTPDTQTITVKPSMGVMSVTLTGSEALMERLEDGIIGWHKMTVASPTTLTFPCPAGVARSYTVANPGVVGAPRIAGAVDLQTAISQYERGYVANQSNQDATAIHQAWMFICPAPTVALSKDRMAQGDAIAEVTPASDFRQLITDGFTVYVFIPAEDSSGGITCSDLANGEILSAVLRTFHGLVLPRAELFQANTFVALMVEHGGGLGVYNKATYVHGYMFQAPAYLTQWDSIPPFAWSDIRESVMTPPSGLGPGTSGGVIDVTKPVPPIGSVALRGMRLQLNHDDAPQPLTATVDLT